MNVIKCAPETAIKLALNDRMKKKFSDNSSALQPHERAFCGGISGVVSQVRMTRFWIGHASSFASMTLGFCLAQGRNISFGSLAYKTRSRKGGTPQGDG